MKTEVIIPKDEAHWLGLRSLDVTSTEVSALFGISPYTTLFELWWRKKNGTAIEFHANERVKWGLRLQDSIAAGIAEDQGWNIRRMTEYIHAPDVRMGASFDFSIEPDPSAPAEQRLLEIKNVDGLAFKDGWIVEDDRVEAPPHIEMQIQQQLALSGASINYIGALIGGNRVALIKREPDQAIITAIHERVAQFWTTITNNEQPSPDFTRDAAFIAKLYNYAEPGKVIENPTAEIGDLVRRYKEFGQTEKEAGEAKQAVKAQLLTLIGEAEKVIGSDFSISAGMIGPTRVEYDRKGYRDFRIFKKGSKQS